MKYKNGNLYFYKEPTYYGVTNKGPSNREMAILAVSKDVAYCVTLGELYSLILHFFLYKVEITNTLFSHDIFRESKLSAKFN